MKKFLLVVAAGALAAPAAVAVPVAHADSGTLPPGLGVRLLDAPTSGRNDPRAYVYVVDAVRPGAVFTRHVEVSNGTDRPMGVTTYPAAAVVDSTGFVVGDGHARNDLTSWITMSPSQFTLPPESSRTVSATFRVPSRVVGGERYAVLLAETKGSPGAGSSVVVNSRVGVRVYLDVTRGTVAPSDFSVSTLTAGRSSEGQPTVSAQVTNTGKRAVDVVGDLTLTDGPGGLQAGPFHVAVPRTIGIGEHGDVLVALDRALPAGPWHARMDLQSGTVKHSVESTITFPAKAGTAAKPVKAHPVPLTKNRHVLVPVAVGLILALLAGLVLFLLWRRRRKDDDEQEAPPAGGPPAVPAPRRAVDDETAARSQPSQ